MLIIMYIQLKISSFIAATSRLFCTAVATSRLRLFCRCDLLQQPIAATCRSNLSHSPPILAWALKELRHGFHI